MPVIIITNIRNVSVDGSPVGSLVNAFNESKDPVAVQIALESFCDNLETASKAIAESHAVELAKLTASHAASITELEAQHAADLVSAVEAEGRAVHNRLDALVQAGQEAHAAGDLDALGKVLVSAYAHTSKARKAKLEAELDRANAAVAAVTANLAAL